MQILIEVMAAIVVWAAALAFSQFGIEVDLPRPTSRPENRTIQRSPRPQPQAAAKAVDADCPEANTAAIRRI